MDTTQLSILAKELVAEEIQRTLKDDEPGEFWESYCNKRGIDYTPQLADRIDAVVNDILHLLELRS